MLPPQIVYLLDATWLNEWKNYVQYDQSTTGTFALNQTRPYPELTKQSPKACSPLFGTRCNDGMAEPNNRISGSPHLSSLFADHTMQLKGIPCVAVTARMGLLYPGSERHVRSVSSEPVHVTLARAEQGDSKAQLDMYNYCLQTHDVVGASRW